MAKRNYEKEIRALRKELRKRISQHKKRSDVQLLIERTKKAKKLSESRAKKKIVKRKPKKVIPKKLKPIKVRPKKVKPKKVVRKLKPKKVVRKLKPKRRTPKKVPKKPKKVRKPRVKWYEKKSAVKIYMREVGDARGFSEDVEDAPEEVFMNSSNGNRTPPNEENLKKIFENAFSAFLKKGPFEKDEINIYRHGVIFRPVSGEWNPEIERSIISVLEELSPDSSIHITKEDKTFSMRVNFGSPSMGISYEAVADNYQEIASIVRRIYDTMYDYGYDDIDWFDFWDTEEAMYD